jgi:phage tail-like protein
MFNDKKKAVEYIQEILDEEFIVNYYRLRTFLKKHAIEVNYVKLVEIRGAEELSLVSIDRFNEDESIDLTLNSRSLMNFLPMLYHRKDFLKRYLFGVQSSMLSINETIFNISSLFRPEQSDFIEWLSSWFGIRYGNITDEQGRRRVVANAVDLYKSRGTKEYFIKLIKALIDVEVEIDDNKYSKYNLNRSTNKQNAFTVIINKKISDNPSEESRKYSIIQNIFELEKPVNTALNIEYNYNISVEEKVEEKVIIYANDSYDY